MIELPSTTTGVQRFEYDAMGCTFAVWLVHPEPRYARQAARAAFDELTRLEELLSRFVPTSDIAQLNAAEPGQPVRVSIETIECLELAAAVHAEAGGAFDVCYRGQHTTDRRGAPLILDPDAPAVGRLHPNATVDLGGIGKGYALDRMLAVLQDWSLDDALLHSGQSTVLARGGPAEDESWTIGLRDATVDAPAWETIALGDQALAGSGQELHGGHIVDPRSGEPAPATRCAWALTDSAAAADAYSTAFMLLAPADVARCCGQRPGLSAILRTRSPDGTLVTERFPASA